MRWRRKAALKNCVKRWYKRRCWFVCIRSAHASRGRKVWRRWLVVVSRRRLKLAVQDRAESRYDDDLLRRTLHAYRAVAQSAAASTSPVPTVDWDSIGGKLPRAMASTQVNLYSFPPALSGYGWPHQSALPSSPHNAGLGDDDDAFSTPTAYHSPSIVGGPYSS
jgi:hypothetical protein